MAKDGTNRGGARAGAGQKKKPLHDKILEGNPGKRPLTVMEFSDTADLTGKTMPPPREFLKGTQKSGKQTLAVEIYESTWKWLYERRCAHLIPAQLLEQYAMSPSQYKGQEKGTRNGMKHRITRNLSSRLSSEESHGN